MDQPEKSYRAIGRKDREFVHLMSASQMNIYAYIMSIVGNSSDADDIMQNTSVLMWERFSEYESGTDFKRWGISIAYYKIKEFRKQNKQPQFNDEVFEKIHDQAHEEVGNMNLFIEKMRVCLTRLSQADLDIVKLRYQSGYSIKKVALRFNTSVQAVYMKLSKIHGILSRCIKLSIMQESIG